jgi:AcrR family transcriptional regulator
VGRSLGPAADRAIERGQALIAAAGRLVQRNGEDFTMQQVAVEAGLSLRAIYQYFAGKDELLIALIEESGGVLVRLVNRAIEPYTDPLERLGAALYFMTDARQHTDHEYNATMSRFVARTWTSAPDQLGRARRAVTELLAQLIREATEAGVLEPGDVTQKAADVALSLNGYQMNAHLGSALGVPLPPNLVFVRFALLGLGAQIPSGWEDRLAIPDAEARRRRQMSERMAFSGGRNSRSSTGRTPPR